MMTSSRLVRSTKGRLFACLGVLTLFAGVVFLYHSTRVELDVVRNSLSKCHQEQDSLAAQVQVISEYKKNLEKSLNQEKAEHRQTKEQLQAQMNDEQQLRNKENIENVKKYKALQQQYNLLKSEHEDLNENCNKAKSEQASCAEALSHMESQLTTLHQEQEIKDAQVDSLKSKFMRLEEENKVLLQKLTELQKENDVDKLHDKDKVLQAVLLSSSTKQGDTHETAHGADGIPLNEQPQNVLPVAQKSSTAAQEEILQPARPAQPGLLQSAASKKTGNRSAMPQINPDTLTHQHKASHQSILSIPDMPILLSSLQKSASFARQDFVNHGPQGVLPAPLGFGNENQYAQQNAAPLQAPYRLQQLGQQEVPQNQGQIPPLAPVVAAQNNVLPAPPDSAHAYQQQALNFNPQAHQIMNPFRSDMNILSQDFMAHPDSKINPVAHNLHKFDGDLFHLNGLKVHEPMHNIHKNSDLANKHKLILGQDVNNHPLAHGSQFDRPGNAASFHKNIMKNFNAVPLDGDVNQHQDLGIHNGNPFAGLNHRNPDVAHGKHHAQPIGQQEGHHAAAYNYQGGEYDKEDPPVNNEEDEDMDQIDYNNEPNPGHAAHPVHVAPKVVRRRFAEPNHHQDGIMVNPR